jgi:hypothetical protein
VFWIDRSFFGDVDSLMLVGSGGCVGFNFGVLIWLKQGHASYFCNGADENVIIS